MAYTFLHTVYDAMSEGLYVFDENATITHINPAAKHLLGYDEHDLVGKIGHFIFHPHPEHTGLLECPIYKAFLQDKPYVGQEVFVSKKGEALLMHLRVTPIVEEGEKRGYVMLFSDISELKRLEKECEAMHRKQQFDEVKNISPLVTQGREKEVFYEKIFETANLGICLTDTQGRFVALNPAYCAMYGYSEAELIGKHFTVLVPDAHKAKRREFHQDFLHDKNHEVTHEWESVRKDGQRLYVYASVGVLEHIIGGPYKITTVSDITTMVEARHKQHEHEALLMQQSKLAAMGEMLGHIAHQWRQPLHVINCTTLDVKLKKASHRLSDEILEKALWQIETLSQQMSETIDDFMNFYKPNKQKKDFLLYEVILNAYKIVSPQFKNNKITLSLNVDTALVLHGSFSELQHVMLNLITNAKDAFMASKRENKQLCIVAKELEHSVVISVEDNAGGITQGLCEKIFEPYFTTKNTTGGVGIGLYMCSMIIHQSFGGAIYAENILDASEPLGARFVMTLPKECSC